MTSAEWKVEIVHRGRSGTIHYTENGNTVRFDFEIGGSVLAIIWPPEAQSWDTKFPWAAGRRAEIIERTIKEVLRQQAPNSSAEHNEQQNVIYIK